MSNKAIAIATTILIALTILIAVIASESVQYSNPITIENGVTYVTTDQGDQVYSDVEYITGHVVSVKPVAINTLDSTPVALPNTSAPNGAHTCDMGKFTVTTDQNCAELK